MNQTSLRRLAWATLAATLVVVAWGGYVRASGSGAGCGSHWPLCNGVALPRAASAETLIEFTHRTTSGLAFLLVALLLWQVRRSLPHPHPARAAALTAMAFMVLEALVGAWLVLFGLVAENDSMARAVVLGVHLVNTFVLLGALALTAWWVSGNEPLSLQGRSGRAGIWAVALVGLLIVGVTGAITALGDTLFPASSLAAGLRQDLSPTAHLLVRLRVLHPMFAVLVACGMLVLALGAMLRDSRAKVAQLGRLLGILILGQLGVGVVNLLLLAPIPLQLVHLVMADLVWIGAVLLAAAQLGASRVLTSVPDAVAADPAAAATFAMR